LSGGLATALLLAWMQACSLQYGVEPEFAWAVARVESGTKTESLRCGRLGRSRYYGPMGINRCFLNRWPIDDPYVNVEVGVKALRGADKRRVLKRYNAAFDEAYYRAVMALYRQAQREGMFYGRQ
jgi:hypothetical protein